MLIKLIVNIKESQVRHKGGKTRVINELIKERKREENYIGIIDEDPGSPGPQKEFKRLFKLERKEEKLGIKIYGNEKGDKIIMLCPDLEGWLFKIIKRNQLNLDEFGFSKKFEEFKKQIKSDIKGCERLINNIKNTEEISFLKQNISKWKR